MNYAEIKYNDIADGPGVRTSLFVSGCTHHCKECFNAMTWDFGYGQPFTDEVAQQIIDSCKTPFIKGLTLLGGEPMEPSNQEALLPFIRAFRKANPDKSIWCYSGYTFEELTDPHNTRCHCAYTDELLQSFDVLVDGEFVLAKKDISLRFRGSSNQRLLDMPASLAAGKPVLWEDEKIYASHAL